MLELLCAIGLGIVIILISLANIFLKDLAWDLTEWSNRAGGRVSERTREWEIMTTIVGVLGILGGIVLIIWAASIA